jgi:hypothetical protein
VEIIEMRVAVCALALAGLTALGACASNNHDMADTGAYTPVAQAEPAPPPAYTPPPPPAYTPPPVETTTRAGERG